MLGLARIFPRNFLLLSLGLIGFFADAEFRWQAFFGNRWVAGQAEDLARNGPSEAEYRLP